ncbi:MAG: hypothetical protein M1830_008275 [Pleopsidium flavum]|nr:MAG: hypothetical protein M1830_008275 [Pleopsidium flavum]
MTESDVSGIGNASNHSGGSPLHSPPGQLSPQSQRPSRASQWGYSTEANEFSKALKTEPFEPEFEAPSIESAARSIGLFPPRADEKPEAALMSRGTTASGVDEEAVNHTLTRMLQDPTGRLLYVGDSATLSYLQLLRMMVESVAGPSAFTVDPRRHRIMENTMTVPSSFRPTHLLPDKQTAQVLVNSYFMNTHGLLQVFDRRAFLESLDSCYSDPLKVDPNWLCLLNLVFAIGLALATPALGSTDAIVINKLRKELFDQAEIFYVNARSLNDPIIGFEDAGFWSIQALLLMAVYMLTVSKRNTAFAYFGMAARSAFALGLHREETLVIFTPEDQAVRRNLWRSLYVLDRFLSASLGRPAAISEDDCSGDALNPPNLPTFPGPTSFNQTNTLGLEASVRSCRVIGIILRKVYQKRKISTKLAQEIADQCKLWPKALSPTLHWRQASATNPSQGIAILHVNLFYCHSIILLTRPFFLHLLNAEIQKNKLTPAQRKPRTGCRMEKFSEACVIASTHTIVLVQNAFEGRYLQQRNAFVTYFLFAAALVVLSNEFASLYINTSADQCIESAITIIAYCGESDPQASRLLYILTTFRDVVATQARRTRAPHFSQSEGLMQSLFSQIAQNSHPTAAAQTPQNSTTTFGPPVENIAPTTSNDPPSATDPSAPVTLPHSRHGSFSGLLDLSGNALTVGSDESSAPDEQIEFDALWQWPTTTPAVGTPGFDAGIQGISDSTVPLFGMTDMS